MTATKQELEKLYDVSFIENIRKHSKSTIFRWPEWKDVVLNNFGL